MFGTCPKDPSAFQLFVTLKFRNLLICDLAESKVEKKVGGIIPPHLAATTG